MAYSSVANPLANKILKEARKKVAMSRLGGFKDHEWKASERLNLTEEGEGGNIPEGLQKLQNAESYEVHIGIPSAYSSRPGEGINNAELGFIHTNGVAKKAVRTLVEREIANGLTRSEAQEKVYAAWIREHGSPVWRIPPRPFLKPAILANKQAISAMLLEALSLLVVGKEKEGVEMLERIGLEAQADVQEWFRDPRNNWEPNAPSTVKRKKSDKPVVDTHEMLNSITYIVVTPNSTTVGQRGVGGK